MASYSGSNTNESFFQTAKAVQFVMQIQVHSKGFTIRVLFWLPIWIHYLWDSIMALIVTLSNVLLYQLLHRRHFWKVALCIQSSGKCKNAKKRQASRSKFLLLRYCSKPASMSLLHWVPRHIPIVFFKCNQVDIYLHWLHFRRGEGNSGGGRKVLFSLVASEVTSTG